MNQRCPQKVTELIAISHANITGMLTQQHMQLVDRQTDRQRHTQSLTPHALHTSSVLEQTSMTLKD